MMKRKKYKDGVVNFSAAKRKMNHEIRWIDDVRSSDLEDLSDAEIGAGVRPMFEESPNEDGNAGIDVLTDEELGEMVRGLTSELENMEDENANPKFRGLYEDEIEDVLRAQYGNLLTKYVLSYADPETLRFMSDAELEELFESFRWELDELEKDSKKVLSERSPFHYVPESFDYRNCFDAEGNGMRARFLELPWMDDVRAFADGRGSLLEIDLRNQTIKFGKSKVFKKVDSATA